MKIDCPSSAMRVVDRVLFFDGMLLFTLAVLTSGWIFIGMRPRSSMDGVTRRITRIRGTGWIRW